MSENDINKMEDGEGEAQAPETTPERPVPESPGKKTKPALSVESIEPKDGIGESSSAPVTETAPKEPLSSVELSTTSKPAEKIINPALSGKTTEPREEENKPQSAPEVTATAPKRAVPPSDNSTAGDNPETQLAPTVTATAPKRAIPPSDNSTTGDNLETQLAPTVTTTAPKRAVPPSDNSITGDNPEKKIKPAPPPVPWRRHSSIFVAVIMERTCPKQRWGISLQHDDPLIAVAKTEDFIKDRTSWGAVVSGPAPPEAFYCRCVSDEDYFKQQFLKGNEAATNITNTRQTLLPGDRIVSFNGEPSFKFLDLLDICTYVRGLNKLIIIAKRPVSS